MPSSETSRPARVAFGEEHRMQQQAGADAEVMEVLEHAVDDERAVLHHRLGEAAAAVALRCDHDADLDRLGAQREKIQRLGAELRALLSGDSRRDVGRAARRTGGR